MMSSNIQTFSDFLVLRSPISYRCSIVTPVSLIRKAMSKDSTSKAERASQFARSKSKDKAEKVSPEINDDIEEEEDCIEQDRRASDPSFEKVDKEEEVEKADEKEEVEEEARDAAPAEEAHLEEQEPEEKESEDEFNQIVDPEVEERVLVLTESVDDLRAEFLEFKRSSTIERERLEDEVRRAKEELEQFKYAPPADDDSIEEVITYKKSSKVGVLELLSNQFDDEGYMKCMLD